jgi:hypothetical protein
VNDPETSELDATKVAPMSARSTRLAQALSINWRQTSILVNVHPWLSRSEPCEQLRESSPPGLVNMRPWRSTSRIGLTLRWHGAAASKTRRYPLK